MGNDDISAIMGKLENMEKYVLKIDASITGDPQRGVIGITQHIETLHKNYHEHAKDDDARFEKLDKITEGVKEEISGFKKYWAGAAFVVVVLVGAIELIVKISKG